MTAGASIFLRRCAPPCDFRVVLLDENAERHWMQQSPAGEWIRCGAGDWDRADQWFARALASPLTARCCMKWVAARLGIDSLTQISAPLRARIVERLTGLSEGKEQLVARLCIQVLGWGPQAKLERSEFWQALAGCMPGACLPRIVVEGNFMLEEADRIAIGGVSIGFRVSASHWERFLAGNNWRHHAARWRLAPVFGGSILDDDAVERSDIPGTKCRCLVEACAPDAIAQFEIAAALIKNEQASHGGESGEARSAVEALLFSVLDARPLTHGRFSLNSPLDFQFGTRSAEGDLVAHHARLVVEIDSYFHFRDSDGYRRARRKDAALQEHGWFVLRFLAADIVRDLEGVLARIEGHLARLSYEHIDLQR
ncbi:MAG: hypothetical protein JWL59_4403 [Chthoniobacteraceae bacterium]|nr:hypothetical protein [Chthoniobacteraceae bacterium]